MSSASSTPNDLTIPAPHQAELRAVAAMAQCPANEIVREALETYLAHRHTDRLTPNAEIRATSAARMRTKRKGRILPDALTIEQMIAHGRA